VARKQYGGEDGTPAFGVGTVKGKGGAKQSGSRSKPGAVQKCCAAQGNRAEDGRLGDGYDSDGVRMVWASGKDGVDGEDLHVWMMKTLQVWMMWT